MRTLPSVVFSLCINVLWLCPLQAVGCSTEKTTVYYINGINNPTWASAYSARKKLNDEYFSSKAPPLGCVYFELLYNNNELLFLDYYESAKQFISSNVSDFWRIWSNSILAPDWFKDLARKKMQAADQARYIKDSDLRGMISSIKTTNSVGNKIVLVGHSQGNFYANEVHRILKNDPIINDLGFVAVATPAVSVAGKRAPYTTNHRDIINVVPSSLPGNMYSPCGLDTVLCHSFVNAYMYENTPRTKIIADIENTIANLVGTPQQQPPTGQQPPTAVIIKKSPSQVNVGDTVTFDSASSTDDVDNIGSLLVRWDFNSDGTFDTKWLYQKIGKWTYPNPGNYDVVLEVKDSGGLVGRATYSLLVSAKQAGSGSNANTNVTGTGTVTINGVIIGPAVFVQDVRGMGCGIRVHIQNTTKQIKSLGLMYNAFDNAGNGIAMTSIQELLTAKSTKDQEMFWFNPGSKVDCASITSFELDTTNSIVAG